MRGRSVASVRQFSTRWTHGMHLNSCSFTLRHQRYFSQETVSWLKGKGYSEQVATGIIAAFPSPPSVGEIQALGDVGLNALASAVEKEVKRFEHSADIEVVVSVARDNSELRVMGKEGETLCELAARESLLSKVLECSCRGIAACSTCHVYVDKKFAPRLPTPEENELDMLDLAWGVKDNSRLGCQIKLHKNIDGMRIQIPEQSNNLYN